MKQLIQLLAICLNSRESDLTIETTSEDLDSWDSIGAINIVIALESEYGITLAAEEVAEIKSVKNIIEVLGAHKIVITG